MIFKRTLYNSDVNVLIPFENLYRWVPLYAIYAQSVGDSQVIFTVYISEIAANAISKCAYNICNNEYLHVSISKLVHSSTTVTITEIL